MDAEAKDREAKLFAPHERKNPSLNDSAFQPTYTN